MAAVAEFGSLTTWVNNAGGSPMRMPLADLPREMGSHDRAQPHVGLRRLAGGRSPHPRHRWDRLDHQHLVGSRVGSGTRERSLRRCQGRHQLAHLDPVSRTGTQHQSQRGGAWRDPDRGDVESRRQDRRSARRIVGSMEHPTRTARYPQDIGAACLYLASDAASWVSGEILRVGGGAKPR